MISDITDYIECQILEAQEATWTSIRDLYPLYQERNYDSFGCLFGWQNFAHFRPIATERGPPP